MTRDDYSNAGQLLAAWGGMSATDDGEGLLMEVDPNDEDAVKERIRQDILANYQISRNENKESAIRRFKISFDGDW